jgi:hypothetical protein
MTPDPVLRRISVSSIPDIDRVRQRIVDLGIDNYSLLGELNVNESRIDLYVFDKAAGDRIAAVLNAERQRDRETYAQQEKEEAVK